MIANHCRNGLTSFDRFGDRIWRHTRNVDGNGAEPGDHARIIAVDGVAVIDWTGRQFVQSVDAFFADGRGYDACDHRSDRRRRFQRRAPSLRFIR